MRFLRVALVVAAATAILLGLLAVRRWSSPVAGEQAAANEVWTCSMHPQVRLPAPGRCPICGMNLIPVSQLASQQASIAERAGIETASIEKRALFKEIRTVGKLDYDERHVALIAARVAGRVDRAYADFTGMTVKKGDHLVDIYSPDLYSAQRELLIALEGKSESLIESARTKLTLLGILPEQIREIETTKKMRTHLTIYAPIGGVVIEKDVRAGQYVKDGDPLYRIADLDPIWLYLDIYENDLAWVRFGQQVDVRIEAYPAEVFKGTVAFIEPFLNDATRTVKVRVNLKNGDLRLKPQMYATAIIQVNIMPDGTPAPTGLEGKYICPMHPEIVRDDPCECPICGMQLERVPGEPASAHADEEAHQRPERAAEPGDHDGGVLAVPVSAVLDTGTRQIAYRRTPAGTYELVELKLGPRAEVRDRSGKSSDFFPLLSGLDAGDQVVAQGGFLLDSQRQIEGMPSLLFPQGMSGPAQLHSGHAMPEAPKGKVLPSPAGEAHKH